MEWPDEKVLLLIEEYKARPGLWDPSLTDYKLLNKKNDNWRSLAFSMDTDVGEVKKKINSLLASLRRERTKERKKSGMAANDVYKSTWFAYNAMTFLLEKFKVKDTRSSEDTVHNDEEEIVNGNNIEIPICTTAPENLEESDLTTQAERQNEAPAARSSNPKRTTKRMRKLDAQFDEALGVIKSVSNRIGGNKPVAAKSTDDVFGEYIASKLRGYSVYTKNYVQHQINNILFDADMGVYNEPAKTAPLSISPLPQQLNSGPTYSSSHHSSPSLLLSNEDGTEFIILDNDTTQI